jgi:hypothetical protein
MTVLARTSINLPNLPDGYFAVCEFVSLIMSFNFYVFCVVRVLREEVGQL